MDGVEVWGGCQIATPLDLVSDPGPAVGMMASPDSLEPGNGWLSAVTQVPLPPAVDTDTTHGPSHTTGPNGIEQTPEV